VRERLVTLLPIGQRGDHRTGGWRLPYKPPRILHLRRAAETLSDTPVIMV